MEREKKEHAIVRFYGRLLSGMAALFAEIGELTILAGQVLYWLVRPPYRGRVFLESMYFVGVGTIFIVFLVGSFTGAVFALQSIIGLEMFGAENMVGGLVGYAFATEMAPVFTALLLTARAGSAMATELGTMRVTDQIDALATMGISPTQYLVTPRVFACTVMAPVLCMLFNFLGIGGGYVICIIIRDLDPGVFQDTISYWVDPEDITSGLIKVTVLGFFVSLIACRRGFFATGGAAGVGQATTKAVVHGFVVIFILDYFLTSLLQA
ncbi:MAG: ABC transporter permease [Myxococcota bacterium]|nr:ABC transporter permease [Myxococcota bacterium]